MTRVLGVDLGARRIGLALSDATATIAGPLCVLERSGAAGRDHAAILDVAAENGAVRIVVGLPLSLPTGRPGPAAEAVLAEVAALAERAGRGDPPVGVETFDERLTTVTAQRVLAAGGVRARPGRSGATHRRAVVDKVAAAVMLQAWLDSRPARGGPG